MEAPSAQLQDTVPVACMPPHRKVLFLSLFLVLVCIAIAGIGLWGITVVWEADIQIARHDGPATNLLLQTDRDLYQAELALERAAAQGNVSRDSASMRDFDLNITESGGRFEAYRAVANKSDAESKAASAYYADRAKWLESAGQLISSFTVPPAGAVRTVHEDHAMLLRQTQDAFDRMRNHVQQLDDTLYEPRIAELVNRAELETTQSYWRLLASIVVAVLLTLVLITSTVRTMRRQEFAIDRENADRVQQNKRQTFEARLHGGLNMTQDESAALRLVEHVIAEMTPGLYAEILLADSSRAHIQQAAVTKSSGCVEGCTVGRPSDCPAVRCGHRLTFQTGAQFDACPYLKNRAGGNRSAVCVPLSIMGQTVGVLHATAPEHQLPSEEQIFILDQVASKSGERLGMIRALNRFEAQASSDPLTGLMNRRSIEAAVHELSRDNQPYAVAYGDLDHFKRLNDTHGHETGDKALRLFAQTLRSSTRPGDLAARWGGEEFVVILPRATAADAAAVIDRTRAALAQVQRGACTPAFTVSFGVADTTGGGAFSDVVNRADAALLEAKREGRNRTIIAAPAPKASDTENAAPNLFEPAPPALSAA